MAIVGWLDDQVPPETELVKVVQAPGQKLEGPEIVPALPAAPIETVISVVDVLVPSEIFMRNVSVPVYPVVGVNVSAAGVIAPPVDVAVLGKPASVPWAGEDTIVQVSV